MTNVLHLSASSRRQDSVTRTLTSDLVKALEQRDGPLDVTDRDLADGISLINEDWVAANFTPEAERNAAQADTLSESDQLVAELSLADVIVIGAPIYNFGIPAALKAWVDLIARARLTFRYSDSGPEGLLKGKKAYIVVASGGVDVDSPVDFATPYLRQALRFVGITDVEVVGARQAGRDLAEVLDTARADIAEMIHTGKRVRAA